MKTAHALVCVVAAACLASSAYAARPLNVDDAGTEPPGRFKLSAGALFARDEGDDDWSFPISLSYGLVERVEVGVGVSGLIERRETDLGRQSNRGFGDIAASVKWHALDQEQWLADHALAFTLVFPTASQHDELGVGEQQADLTWIATREITKEWAVHVNVGYTFVSGGHEDLFHYGIATEYQLTPVLQPVLEIFAQTPEFNFDQTSAAIDGGVRWKVAESLVLDAAVGGKLRGDAPEIFATVGLSWVFRLN